MSVSESERNDMINWTLILQVIFCISETRCLELVQFSGVLP